MKLFLGIGSSFGGFSNMKYFFRSLGIWNFPHIEKRNSEILSWDSSFKWGGDVNRRVSLAESPGIGITGISLLLRVTRPLSGIIIPGCVAFPNIRYNAEGMDTTSSGTNITDDDMIVSDSPNSRALTICVMTLSAGTTP